MFRTYEFDVKKLLKPGGNTIEIKFDSVLPLMRAKEEPAETAHLGLSGGRLRAEGTVQFRLGLGADPDHLRHLAEDRHRGLRRGPTRRRRPSCRTIPRKARSRSISRWPPAPATSDGLTARIQVILWRQADVASRTLSDP